MKQATYTIKLPVFEGPFDLLFHLIKKAEVDIWTVSIAEITAQYLAYLQTMKELNLDIASEFLVMAATLLRLKSKLLLPRPPSPESSDNEDEIFEINSPEELFNRLEEYRRFKEAALYFKEKERQQQKIYLRSTGGQKMMLVQEQQSYYTFWEGARLLGEIMRSFAEAAASGDNKPVITAVDDFLVTDKVEFICARLECSARALPLSAFISQKGLWELIVTFIALLELARQRRILLLQERPFGAILVSLNRTDAKENLNGT
jgi:segregation and condensation protein A